MTSQEVLNYIIVTCGIDLPKMHKILLQLLHTKQNSLSDILSIDLVLTQSFPEKCAIDHETYLKIALNLALTYHDDLTLIGIYLQNSLKRGETELQTVIRVGKIFHYWNEKPEVLDFSPLQPVRLSAVRGYGFFESDSSTASRSDDKHMVNRP